MLLVYEQILVLSVLKVYIEWNYMQFLWVALIQLTMLSENLSFHNLA